MDEIRKLFKQIEDLRHSRNVICDMFRNEINHLEGEVEKYKQSKPAEETKSYEVIEMKNGGKVVIGNLAQYEKDNKKGD